MADDLPVGYYLDNFSYVLDFVSRQYSDLLTVEESAFARVFEAMSQDARRLYVRLSGRKGPLFRDDKLRYPELTNLASAIDELVREDFLDFAEDAQLPELLQLFTRQELLKFGVDWPKSATRDTLLSLCLQEVTASNVQDRAGFRILRPRQLEILQTYRLLFFGNLHQDFTEFVLNDLGISPYERYDIDPETRFFNERCVLDETQALYAIAEVAKTAIEEGDPDSLVNFESLIPDLVEERSRHRASKIRNRIARELERHDRNDEALNIYGRSLIAPGRERRARLLQKLGNYEGALAICHEIIAGPEDEAEYDFAIGFANRLARKCGLVIDSLPSVGVPEITTTLNAIPRNEALRVEEQARLFLEASGEEAWYVENSLMPGLFGLAFWDVIFHPIRGAFFNPFQRGPSDLFTPAFRENRKSLIDERFELLEDTRDFKDLVIRFAREKERVANHFVHWGLIDEQLIERTFERIPTTHLLSVFRRLMRDLKTNRAGFPDLIVFPATGGYRLVEVKGPGDTLQNNQKRWLRFFAEKGMPAEVMHVEWQVQ